MARRHDEHHDDEVIDLTDRLAPYEESALRTVQLKPPAPPAAPEPPPAWTPLEFDFPYQTAESRPR